MPSSNSPSLQASKPRSVEVPHRESRSEINSSVGKHQCIVGLTPIHAIERHHFIPWMALIHRSEGNLGIHWKTPIPPLKAPSHFMEGTSSTLGEHQLRSWKTLSSRTPFGCDGNKAPEWNGMVWIHHSSQPNQRLTNTKSLPFIQTQPLGRLPSEGYLGSYQSGSMPRGTSQSRTKWRTGSCTPERNGRR